MLTEQDVILQTYSRRPDNIHVEIYYIKSSAYALTKDNSFYYESLKLRALFQLTIIILYDNCGGWPFQIQVCVGKECIGCQDKTEIFLSLHITVIKDEPWETNPSLHIEE